MKKKLLIIVTFLMMSFVFSACDLLSTINAVKGFYDEYQTYSTLYENTTKTTVDTETNLTIIDTNIDGILPVSSHVYLMIDSESPFMYVEQTINDDFKKSVYQAVDGYNIEYLIDDNDVVTPTLPVGESVNSNVSILNENFSYSDVDKENKTGDRTYEFDVFLNQAVNLEALNDFVDQIKIFDENLEAFNNAIAHVIITFADLDSEIDIQATVDNYNITFSDDSSVTFSITNHTVLKIPENFQMPDVFSDDYQMKAVDDMFLARKEYVADQLINYPVMASENGYVKLNLDPGTYQLSSENHLNDISGSMIYDASENQIAFDTEGNYSFVITDAGTYYLYIVPTASFQSDISITSTLTEPTTDTTTDTTTTNTTTE